LFYNTLYPRKEKERERKRGKKSQKHSPYKMPIKALRFSDRVCARLAKRIAAGLHLCKRRGAASRYLKVLREKLARDSLRRLLSRGMHDWQKRERKGPSLSFFKKGAGSNIGIVLAGP